MTTALESDLNNPEYLFQRTDDPTLKAALARIAAQNGVLVGKFGYSVTGYSSLAVATYNLLDIDGNNLVLPNCSIIRRAYLVVDTAFTSGGSATLGCGYSGSATAIIPATAVASMTGDTVIDGTPVASAATMLLRKAETQLTIVVGTAAFTAGLGYVLIETTKLPSFT